VPWPGDYICAEGLYSERGNEKRAGIFVGLECGTMQRADIAVKVINHLGDEVMKVYRVS